MKTRIIVGLFLAALLIATLYLGGYFYLTTIALVSFAATYEVAHVITKKGFRPLVSRLRFPLCTTLADW